MAALCLDGPVFCEVHDRPARLDYGASVLAFGDSLTAGATSPPLTLRPMSAGLPQSYPYKFQQLMAAALRQPDHRGGERRQTGRSGRRRHAPLSGRRAMRFHPEVVVLLHGVNDVAFFGLAACRASQST